jgi:hypothetical protein
MALDGAKLGFCLVPVGDESYFIAMEPLSILQDIFFPRRIARLSYFVRGTACNLLMLAVLFGSGFDRQTSILICVVIGAYSLFFVVYSEDRYPPIVGFAVQEDTHPVHRAAGPGRAGSATQFILRLEGGG